MVLAVIAFLFMAGIIMGGYAAVTYLPGMVGRRQLDQRLREVSAPAGDPAVAVSNDAIVRQTISGPLPALDRFVSATRAGSWLKRLIDRSGVKTTPSAIVMFSLGGGAACGLAVAAAVHLALAIPVGVAIGAFVPFGFLMNRRTSRLRRFEEQFPEALDLLSRAVRAGHAFQSALGMAADELPSPVGPEMKKTFDQQNYGLPLRDVLNDLAERINILDVRFFVTAVLIQRETGGNLAEILDNLSHVVRERFKILRQVRVHSAHGRFTGYVLLTLPAFLAVALSFINPEHMQLLFREKMGQTMLLGAMVMQGVGFLWIRQVIKIEV